MTREEALKRMKWTKGRTGITSEEAEAIGYAIEKLSNSDEDCISRKTVNTLIDELARAISDERCCISRGRYTATIMQEILDLPSIQPKPKTDVLAKIRAEIEQVKSIMNEEIINHDRKDLINFVNGLNQSLAIIDKYKAESENKE